MNIGKELQHRHRTAEMQEIGFCQFTQDAMDDQLDFSW